MHISSVLVILQPGGAQGVVIAGGDMIRWSKKQQRVAISTAGAEYVAARRMAKNLVWLQRLFSKLPETNEQPNLPINNFGTVKLVKTCTSIKMSNSSCSVCLTICQSTYEST